MMMTVTMAMMMSMILTRAHGCVGRLVKTSAKAASSRGRGPKRGGALRPRRWPRLGRSGRRCRGSTYGENARGTPDPRPPAMPGGGDGAGLPSPPGRTRPVAGGVLAAPWRPCAAAAAAPEPRPRPGEGEHRPRHSPALPACGAPASPVRMEASIPSDAMGAGRGGYGIQRSVWGSEPLLRYHVSGN